MNFVQDKHVSINVFVKINDGPENLKAHQDLIKIAIADAKNCPGVLYFNFSYKTDQDGTQRAFGRQGFKDGTSLVNYHKETIGKVQGWEKICQLEKMQCHCTKEEWEVVVVPTIWEF